VVADNRVAIDDCFGGAVDTIDGGSIGENPRASPAVIEARAIKKAAFVAETFNLRFVVLLRNACIVWSWVSIVAEFSFVAILFSQR